MCGIAGFFNFHSLSAPDSAALSSILAAMRYRGPDHTAVFQEKYVSLGYVRLAIIDLGANGQQPMTNEDGSLVVVYNGEIYNYRELRADLQQRGHSFTSTCDTEVLLHLYEEYGADFAVRLNGMFAFAIYDKKKEQLLLGRDRNGQKPLFIGSTAAGIVFASELGPLLPHVGARGLSPWSVRAFLNLGYVPEPHTLFDAIIALDPATIAFFSKSGEQRQRYWQPQPPAGLIKRYDIWREYAQAAIGSSVHRHLESDVPVTLFLSGGTDSGLIASYLAAGSKIKYAYSATFCDRPDHDEFRYALALGQRLGIDVQRVELSNTHLCASLDGFLASATQPMGDYSALAMYCLAKVVARQFRVVLGGEGGDELFAGYPTYSLPALQRRWRFLPAAALHLLQHMTAQFSDRGRYMSLPFQLQQVGQAWGKPPAAAHYLIKNFLPRQLADIILRAEFFEASAPDAGLAIFQYWFDSAPVSDTVRRLCWVDMHTFLSSQTIPKAERQTMHFSLETRMPLLDNAMIDLFLHTDPALMLHGGQRKYCLRRLLAERLPGKMPINPRKQGFSPPLFDLLHDGLAAWEAHWLNTPLPWLHPHAAQAIGAWQKKGYDLHRLQWHICVLADWLWRYKLT